MDQANVKVSFYLKKSESDADGMCPVMARLNVGKYSEAAFSVKLRVPQSMWSSRRASGKSVKAKEINNRLDEIRAMALGVYAELSAVRDDVTAGDVKSLLLGMAGEQVTLLSYFRTLIENFAKRVGVNRTEGSLRSYRNAYNHVERFMREKYNLSDIPFSALNRSFIDDYDSHLRTDCHLAPGTIINLTVQLKIIVGEAVADGIITTYPFTGYEPVRPKQKRKYLTSEELQRIMVTPLHKPHLYLARDMFLFSCYTGIPYSDMRLLSKEHLSLAEDGTCQLLCKVSIDAEWEQIGTKVSVNPDIWNPEKGRANGRSANAVTVNRAIDELTEEITGHYNKIKNSLGFITAELVKNAVMGIGQKPLTLLALFREHNEDFSKRVGLDRIKETLDSYLRSYKHLSAFIKDKKGVNDVTLRSLDKNFYDDFELFLCKDCHMMPKTVHEHLYRLKKMTKLAVSQGTLRHDPYCRLHPALPRRKSRHMKLEDLKKLMETPVEKPQLQFVRDLFLFSTFTGLAYADLKRLKTSDITQSEDGAWWIHIRRQKTDALSSVRLLTLRILDSSSSVRKRSP